MVRKMLGTIDDEIEIMPRRVVINGIPLGWPERILAGVVAVLVIVLGLAFGLVILGLVVAAGLVLAVRIWWLRRRLRRAGGHGGATVVEGEYRVLERHSKPPQ